MADDHDTDRTEDPTQKRLDEALERGDVVKSQEVSTWFVIGGGALMLAAFSGSMSSGADHDASAASSPTPTRSRSTAAA